MSWGPRVAKVRETWKGLGALDPRESKLGHSSLDILLLGISQRFHPFYGK